MTAVQTIRPQDEMPLAIAASIADLTTATWPPAPGEAPPTPEERLARRRERQAAHFIVAEGERVLAHAQIFGREVFTARGPILVGALASVCVHPDFRGRGWGAAVVREAWKYLPELGAPVSLYQTGVPEFYEKLGARKIHNRFFFREPASENPFWDTCAMIYPREFDWPEGDIDLNGPGY